MTVTVAVMLLSLAASMLRPVAAGAAELAELNVVVEGDNGVVRLTEPGRSCAEDGEGSYRHYFADAALPGGVMSRLAGSARSTFDIHYDAVDPKGAFLLGGESHTTLSNQRGSVQIVLRSGTCQAPTLTFDGTTASGTGTWCGGVPLPPYCSKDGTDVQGTGAYRDVKGSGSFSLTAETNPGADNHWELALQGTLSVPPPNLRVEVERTYWGNLGLDYLLRIVTVVYRVGNVAEGDEKDDAKGDAFDVRFQKATPVSGEPPVEFSEQAVKVCGEPQRPLKTCPDGGAPERRLGDMASCAPAADLKECDSDLLVVRYWLGLEPGQPCELVVHGCSFDTALAFQTHDALDNVVPQTRRVTVTAPALPPPLPALPPPL